MFSYTLEIGKKKVKLLTTASTAIYYQQVFGEDLLVFMMETMRSSEVSNPQMVNVAQKVCYIMSKQAEKADMRTLTIDSYIEWLDGMSQIDLINAAVQILLVYKEEMKGTSVSASKKKDEEQSAE